MPCLSREEWVQQIAIPPSATLQTLLLLNSRAAILPSALSPLPRRPKTSAGVETKTRKYLNKTMSVSHKVKKKGKSQATMAVDGYVTLIARNGNLYFIFSSHIVYSAGYQTDKRKGSFEHNYPHGKRRHWSMEPHTSKSQRTEDPSPANGYIKEDVREDLTTRREEWKRDAQQDFIGIGGQFGAEERAR